MPNISQSDNSANSLSISPFEMDEFLPLVSFKDPMYYKAEGEQLIITDQEVKLSDHLDEDKRNFKALQLSTQKRKVSLTFSVKKGGSGSWDEDGFIEVKPSVKDKNIKFLNDTKILTSYDADIRLELEIAGKESKDFYIDFFANDNEDSYNNGEYKNVHCGRFLFSIKEKPSKVGLRLTSNIEKLPKAPASYVMPPIFSDPEASFKVANKYQDCGGMCFAVSMARVRQAYLDEFNVDVLDLSLKGTDYLYSGTVINEIPPHIFGYGVGGVLFSKGYAELVNHKSVWLGKLKEGAMIQYWRGSNLVEIFNRIKRRSDTDRQGGHSVVFKSYRYTAGKITGINYYDYSGIDGFFSITDNKVFLAANLKDI